MNELPVVIIGAGPQGLAAAAHLAERGLHPLVLEQGESAGSAVAEWGHVRLFSEWGELVDRAAVRLLEPSGWRTPSGYPTGAEWAASYLTPLADALGDRVRFRARVTGVSRRGSDRVADAERVKHPFVVHVDEHGVASTILARAVIDASGTWSQPRPAGADGLPARGERANADRIGYRVPEDVSHLAGTHIVVIGGGHSAAHAALRLSRLAENAAGTRVTWLLRRGSGEGVFGGGDADGLPERAALGARARGVVERGSVELVTGFRVTAFERTGETMTVVADDGRRIDGVHQVYALTGFRPDLSFLGEMRLDLDPALEAVAGIAGEIDPHIHSCGTVAATGARELTQPEPDFYILGAKSYGRAPTFLALTGYEQVRSVVAALAGDHEAAARNELELPATGVCGGSGDLDAGASCCGPTVMQIQPRTSASVVATR